MSSHQSHQRNHLHCHKPTSLEYIARHCDIEIHRLDNATFYQPLSSCHERKMDCIKKSGGGKGQRK